MRKLFIGIASGLVLVGGAGAGVVAFEAHRNADNASVQSAGGSIALNTGRAATEQRLTPSPLPSPSTRSLTMDDKTTPTPLPKSATLPEPAEFGQYDQYKTAPQSLYTDIVAGTGDEAVSGKEVTVNYRGWLTNGQVFDESYARKQPFSFTLGARQVISGWDNGVAGMKVGGKRRLIIPPSAGYGNNPVGSIPAGSLLVFDVELLQVK